MAALLISTELLPGFIFISIHITVDRKASCLSQMLNNWLFNHSATAVSTLSEVESVHIYTTSLASKSLTRMFSDEISCSDKKHT